MVDALQSRHALVPAQVDTTEHCLRREREYGREGTDDVLVRDLERAEGTRAETRLSYVQLVHVDRANAVVAVLARLVCNCRKPS